MNETERRLRVENQDLLNRTWQQSLDNYDLRARVQLLEKEIERLQQQPLVESKSATHTETYLTITFNSYMDDRIHTCKVIGPDGSALAKGSAYRMKCDQPNLEVARALSLGRALRDMGTELVKIGYAQSRNH